eukprot:scaffold18815_cov116-Isochrysis_galbana.AAC.1
MPHKCKCKCQIAATLLVMRALISHTSYMAVKLVNKRYRSSNSKGKAVSAAVRGAWREECVIGGRARAADRCGAAEQLKLREQRRRSWRTVFTELGAARRQALVGTERTQNTTAGERRRAPPGSMRRAYDRCLRRRGQPHGVPP